MRKRKNKKGLLIGGITAGVVVILAGGGVLAWKLLINTTTPQETVKNYFALVEKKQYDKMYDMLSESSKEKISKKNLQSAIRIFMRESRQKILRFRSRKRRNSKGVR